MLSSRDWRWLAAGWAVFAAINIGLMFAMAGAETVPFHFVWVSMALVYGLRPWPLPPTFAVLAVVGVVTGWALMVHAQNSVIGWEETAEVPLMTMMFLAMVWHVRHRIAAQRAAERHASSEHSMRDAQKRFVRFALHELRTPITVARGYAELVRDDGGAQAVEDAAVVLEELDKLERIAARLLTLARVDERSTLRMRPIDLDSLLDRMITRWRPTAQRKWSLHTHAGFVVADAERLETALDSLLENAVRYTGSGDAIQLVGRREADNAVIEVRDEGIGIPCDEQGFVFESFRSGDVRGGTGMGLAIVKSVMEAHAGRVSCDSEPGEGTTFTMWLPVTRPETCLPAASRSSTQLV